MLSVEALLFDLDGTLIDSKKDIALSVHFLQKKYGRPLSSEAQIARFIGDGVYKLVERAIGKRSIRQLENAVGFYKKHYKAHAVDHTRLYPGVYHTLHHFKDKKMAVVTNKPMRVSKFILERLGVLRYFSVVIGGDSTSRKKPHPEGVLLALDRLGVRSHRAALMVGDGAQDVVAGRAAGAWTCGIRSNIADYHLLRQAHPDFTIPSMPSLMRLVE